MGDAPRTAWKYRGRKYDPEMKTNPWTKHVPNAAMFERCLKRRKGISGYLAKNPSLTKNSPIVPRPKIIKQMTVAESQGKVTPPNSKPRRNMTVPPTIRSEPSQSIALRPSRIGVLGVCMSRKSIKMIKATPSHGTDGGLVVGPKMAEGKQRTINVKTPSP